uniref:Uncharacterized protein n=1 Tax=Amphimedon queenslandica TaxID=400682 RepID=A0A1X7VSK8_AMPQE
VMRFEGKHNLFKDVAHRLMCYCNIEKSMAEQHQLYLLFIQMSGYDKRATVGTISQVLVSDTAYKFKIQLKFPTLTDSCAID